MLIWCLVWCLSCLHSYHIFSPLQNHVYVLLNTSLTNVSILARHKPLLSRFSGFSQYLSTHSRSIKQNSWTLCLLDTSKSFCHWHLLDTSRSIEILFSTPPQHQFNLLRSLFLYILEVWTGSLPSQTFQYFSLLSRSKPFLFSKILLPFKILALSKLQFVVMCSKSLILFIFMNFMHSLT